MLRGSDTRNGPLTPTLSPHAERGSALEYGCNGAGQRMSFGDRRQRAGCLGTAAVAVWLGALTCTFAASSVPDAEALALAAKHCTACHSAEPTHPAFAKAPKGIRLDTTEGLRRYAKQIVAQVVTERAMPLGNETDMTDEERERLGAWAEGRE
jgi:mono/diheme cytochrome c family protein